MQEIVGNVAIDVIEKVNGKLAGYIAGTSELAYELTTIEGGYKAKLFGPTKARIYKERRALVNELRAAEGLDALLEPVESKKKIKGPRWV